MPRCASRRRNRRGRLQGQASAEGEKRQTADAELPLARRRNCAICHPKSKGHLVGKGQNEDRSPRYFKEATHRSYPSKSEGSGRRVSRRAAGKAHPARANRHVALAPEPRGCRPCRGGHLFLRWRERNRGPSTASRGARHWCRSPALPSSLSALRQRRPPGR